MIFNIKNGSNPLHRKKKNHNFQKKNLEFFFEKESAFYQHKNEK
jgi:hypothetical protein